MQNGPETTDAELAVAARRGSRAAFAVLVDRHRRRLFRFLRMRTASVDDAEELMQEVFLRSWTRLHQFDPARAFSTWLYTVASRLAVSRDRRPRLPTATERELDDVAGADNPSADVEREEERRNLWDLARRVLGAEPRTALWLFYGDGMSAQEIGAILGKREDAVRAMLYRARERLACHLPKPATCSRDR